LIVWEWPVVPLKALLVLQRVLAAESELPQAQSTPEQPASLRVAPQLAQEQSL